MVDSGFEQAVIAELQSLHAHHSQVLAGLGEVKGEIVALQGTTGQTLAEAKRTNGRVSRLEAWREAVMVSDAAGRGRLEGAATAALTKGQLRAVLAAVTAITALSGTIVGIVVKLL